MSISKLTFRKLKADIKFDSITYKVQLPQQKDGPSKGAIRQVKYILTNASGHFKHGQLHAIMGPSGCGKSSLLNVLTGFNDVASGTIALNDFETTCDRWAHLISPVRSYILQDDFMIPQLTVREQLYYAVELKVPAAADRSRRKEIIDILLSATGLKECSERFLGNVSGGQKKRVSVASELVNYPPIMFLDEPTTGLDSTSCYRLVELLKSVAENGCNVIATIHQPNSRVFAIFDTLTVLHDCGVIAYSGPAMALAESLSRINHVRVPVMENPAEVLFEADNIRRLAEVDPRIRNKKIQQAICSTIMRQHMDKKATKYKGAIECGHTWGPASDESSDEETIEFGDAYHMRQFCESVLPSGIHRFRTLFHRTLLQSRRDVVFFLGRLVAMLACSILIGLSFQHMGTDAAKLQVITNICFIFFLSLLLILSTAIVAIMTSHDFLQVLIREHINSWYAFPWFFISRGIIDNATSIIIQIPCATAMWLMTGQQQVFVPTIFWIILIITVHCIPSHYIALSVAMFTNKATLPQLPFAIMMLNVLFAGYIIRFADLPIWAVWFPYLGYGSIAFKGFTKLAYSSKVANTTVLIPCKSAAELCQFTTGEDVLDFWQIDMTYPVWYEVILLCAYSVFFCGLNAFLLAVYIRKQRRIIARL